MHQAFKHLAKRVGEALATVEQVQREVEAQNEREVKVLDQAAYGADFDDEVTPVQEQVVAHVAEAIERLDEARDAIEAARRALDAIQDL